jgi:hypothetical protein
MVSRRDVALKCRASRAHGVSRAGPSVDDAGRPAGSRVRFPRGPEPIAGLGPGARDGPDRLRVPRPLLDARRAAADVPVRPDLAMEAEGTRRFDERPFEVTIDVPPELAVVDAAPAGVPAGRGAGRGGPGRGTREAGDVADLQPDDHRQHPADPRQGPEELEFRRRRKHHAQPLLAGEDLPGHEGTLCNEAFRRVPVVRREEGERRLEPLAAPAAPAAEQIGRPLEAQPGPWPGWRGCGS